ncbi:MAG: hypothetical protein H7A48_12130 [Akkermansiaceae bacterium]|nr:hypothetical protein [Akkermansiaceae bacterium]
MKSWFRPWMFRRVFPSSAECPGCAAALPMLHEASARLGRPVLIGIGGPGGSGKSTFSLELFRHLGDARLLPLDDYRRPRHERPPGVYGSHPAGNRLDLLDSHLRAARAGQSFERPIFCREHGAARATEAVPAGRFLLAEGEIAAHRGLRHHFDLRILVLADWSQQWRARMGRDRSERSCSLRKAVTLFLISNLRDYPRHSHGARHDADLILRRSPCGRFFPERWGTPASSVFPAADALRGITAD